MSWPKATSSCSSAPESATGRFDTYNPKGAMAGSSPKFFARRKKAGWRDAMRQFHHTDVRTYLAPKSGPYELDQVFVGTYGRLIGCHLLDHMTVTGLSDHAPVVLEVAV